MFSGSPEELAAKQAEMRDLAEEIATQLNRMEELSTSVGLYGSVGMNAGAMATGGGTIRKIGGSWRVVTR